MNLTKPSHFYKDKPLFGLDIGHNSLKVMQLDISKKPTRIIGYGVATFDAQAIADGVITNPQAIGTAMRNLFKDHLAGEITTRRVALAIPGHQTFVRSMQLPKLSSEELREAVQLEIEQYIPLPLQDLYLDYTITTQTAAMNELFVVAVSKKIVQSYLTLTQMVGLEVILIEPTMAACGRFITKSSRNDTPSIVIDFGALTADISILHGSIRATSTIPAGGLVFTEAIRSKLQVDQQKAGSIKVNQGLSADHHQIATLHALEPSLQKIVTGVRRMLRYYGERYGTKNPISQVVMLGGGANMPGLSAYLTQELTLPVRTFGDPWGLFDHASIRRPKEADRLMYATVAGLSLVKPGEVFSND